MWKRWLRGDKLHSVAGAVLGLIGGIAIGEFLFGYFAH